MSNFKYALLTFLLCLSFIGFSQHELLVQNITIEGNQKTKDYIILRELSFQQGESYTTEELAEHLTKSSNNLINTSLFHFANLSLNTIDSQAVEVHIKLTERWYLWPIPEADIDERNFNAWWEHKSLSRISAGLYINHGNSRGRMETWRMTLIAGHNQQFGFAYEFPYINKKKTLGFGLSTLYSARHEVNISTLNDKQEFYKQEDDYAQQAFTSSVYFTHRPDIYLSQLLSLSHNYYNFSDSVLFFNPDYSYNKQNELNYLSLYYKLKLDHRNYRAYPLKGYYADIELQQDGLGVLSEQGFNFFTAKTTLRKYWMHSERIYSAVGFIGKVSTDRNKPHMMLRALGYSREFVRGYEYYVVDGNAFALGKANLKYALIPQRKLKLGFIPTEKFNTIPYAFYLNAFVDAGYVKGSQQSQLQDDLLLGYGLGLDFVTYYDWVMRMEFSLNKLNEHGFYLHFIAPI